MEVCLLRTLEVHPKRYYQAGVAKDTFAFHSHVLCTFAENQTKTSLLPLSFKTEPGLPPPPHKWGGVRRGGLGLVAFEEIAESSTVTEGKSWVVKGFPRIHLCQRFVSYCIRPKE